MGFLKTANRVKRLLHETLQIPAQRHKTASRLDQSIRIDDKVLEKREGNITIIQSGEINTQVVHNISTVLQAVDEMVLEYKATGQSKASEELLMKHFIDCGLTWDEIKERLKKVCFDLVINGSPTQAQAASKLGVARTTVTHYIGHNKQIEQKGVTNDD